MSSTDARWPTRRLRYLADFNPSVSVTVRRSGSDFPLYPMDAIHEFGEPSRPEQRQVGDLLTGYSYLEPTDVGYAKVTPCFENGKGVLGSSLEGPSFATSELTVLRPRSAMNQHFLAYVLQSDTFRTPAIASMTGAGGLRRVSEAAMRDHLIPTPPLPVQRATVDYLDHETAEIDAFVQDLSTAKRLAEERLSAQLEHLVVSSDLRPTELRRHRPSRKSGTSVNGAPWPADPGQPGVLKTGAASQRQYRPHENKSVTDPTEQARLTTPVEADRVLVNRANTPSNVGAAAYVNVASNSLFLSDKLWSIDFEGLNEYFAIALQTRLYQDQASQRAVGTSLSMQNLPYDEFLSIRVPVPSLTEQESICKQARELRASITSANEDLDRAITLAEERRAALITAAVTGELDVTKKIRSAAEQLEEDLAH